MALIFGILTFTTLAGLFVYSVLSLSPIVLIISLISFWHFSKKSSNERNIKRAKAGIVIGLIGTLIVIISSLNQIKLNETRTILTEKQQQLENKEQKEKIKELERQLKEKESKIIELKAEKRN